MDYALQVHGSKYIFPIPDGLKELSSDIIREVLRHQPEHINGFIADYLEAMLIVREDTRDSAAVMCKIYEESHFYSDLYQNKQVTREEANKYATKIEAAWRGYVVRRKLSEWIKKKKKIDEERERKRTLKIEELLAGMGITYEEATRAAGIIQTAFKASKHKYDLGEMTIGEQIPFGQRIREDDKAHGRFAKWDMSDFGDFFEMNSEGAIKYNWPKVGQLVKMLREDVPEDWDVVEFFAARDLQGQEQYSYLIKSQSKLDKRGVPIGFLIPISRSLIMESTTEVIFVNPEYAVNMGSYTYIFKDVVDREEIQKFDDLLKTLENTGNFNEDFGELDYDPHWVLPRVIVRIKPEFLQPTDLEVEFTTGKVVCEEEPFSFRAETLEQTAKIVRFILREETMTIEAALQKAINLSPYKVKETGRIFAVEMFDYLPKDLVQKIEILPESSNEDDSKDLATYEFVFLPQNMKGKKIPKGESPMKIYITRFQGYHSDYQGSAHLGNKVFIMGPRLAAQNGKALTYDSLFWDEFGEQAWHQLLYNLARERFEEEHGDEEVEGEGEGESMHELSGEIDYSAAKETGGRVKIKTGTGTNERSASTVPYNESVSEGEKTALPRMTVVSSKKSTEGEEEKKELPEGEHAGGKITDVYD